MKVFVDTNVLFSAILFPNSMPDLALHKALSAPCVAITSDYCLEELSRKFAKKFPNKIDALNAFLTSLLFCIRIIKVSDHIIDAELMIRDIKDRPVLRSAIEAGADVLVTGDRDLLESGVTHPKIITASEFYNNF